MKTETVLRFTGLGILGLVVYKVVEAMGNQATPAAQASIKATTPTLLNQLFTSDSSSTISALQQMYCANDEYYDRAMGRCVRSMSSIGPGGKPISTQGPPWYLANKGLQDFNDWLTGLFS